ncbi:MAG: polysaccharide pyruvyl transferase family protein [Ferruginibacter sp.]
MKKVFLVTKLNTTNIGNQALSMELIKLFTKEIGKDNLYVCGRPIGLYAYDMDKLIASAEPEKLFDKWADAVVKKFRSSDRKTSFKPGVEKFKLTRVSAVKYEGVKTFLRPVKRMLKRFSLYDKTYMPRIANINSCDVLIYSGAGEVSDNHVFLRQMLEIRIAQKLGKQTGAVNQSLVVNTDTFKKIVNLVYGNMNQIVVRGAISKADIASFGVDINKIMVAPDTAIRTIAEAGGVKKKGSVGINITPLLKYEWKDVEAIVGKLRQYNKEIVFITNEPLGDLPIQERFKTSFNIDALPEPKNYMEYAKQLSGFDYIISARLHTNVMSLAGGVPVIPIEGMVFKTKELFAQFEYPIPAINVNDANWVQAIIDSIDSMEKGNIDFPAYFKNVLVKHKEDVKYNVSWVNKN